jgi:ribose transport system permease protein
MVYFNMKKLDVKSGSLSLLGKFGPFLGLILVFVLFVIIGPDNFARVRTLETIARQATIVGIASLGMTMVIIIGGIDLSVGSIVALSSVVIATVLGKMVNNQPGMAMFDVNAGVWVALLAAVCGIAIGALCGFINGLIITRLQVVPFIVTLGTLLLVRGVAKGIAHEQKVNAPISWLNDLLAARPKGEIGSILPVGIWLLIFLLVALVVFLRYSRTGRQIYAIGSNEQTARLCGVAVKKVKLLVYALSAGFAGLAGVMQFSRLSVGDPTVAVGLELDVIAAVVIGGGSLSGGEGTVVGSLIGALIMTVIGAGCSQMGLPNWVQEIVAGVIIVVAVVIDRLRRSGKE